MRLRQLGQRLRMILQACMEHRTARRGKSRRARSRTKRFFCTAWRPRLAESLEPRLALSAATAITVAASSTQAVYGQAITLTATVAASTTAPSEGTVTFSDNGNVLGTAAVSSGTATLTNVSLNAGNYQITASYSDSLGNYASSVTTPQANSLITTIAGDGVQGSAGINGPATSAQLYWPKGVAVDSAGDLFIADSTNNRVLEVNHGSGIITIVAGNGTYGYSGDGGLAASAELRDPTALAFDAAGDLFIADYSNNCVREVNHATGIISTVAGMGPSAYGYSGDGGLATAAKLFYPDGLAIDSAGDLFIADQANNRIREVNASTGIITTVAGNGSATDTGDGGAASSATVNYPQGLAFDSAGDLFIAEYHGWVVREIQAGSGIITTVAGNGVLGGSGRVSGPATSIELDDPSGVAVAPGGALYIADSVSHRILEVDPITGIVTTIVDADNGLNYGGDGGALAFDSAGDLIFDDTWNNRVREVSNGTLVTITPASLTITAQNQTKVYGAALPALTAGYSGFVNDDSAASLTAQPSFSTTATAASSVAGSPYTITVSGAVDPNYTITYVSGSLTVTPVALTITADDQTKVYGAALPTLTANYSGFVNGDNADSLTTPPALSTTATATSSVAGGPYAVTASGAVDANYLIGYVAGSLSVTQAALTITADNKTKVYGAALPILSASYSGFVNGNSTASLSTQPTLSTTATAGSPVGRYVITVDGAADPNYMMTYTNGVLTVVLPPAPVDDIYVIGSGTVTVAAANGVLANDTPSGTLTVSAGAVTGTTGGTFLFHADGSFIYMPPANFAGYDQAKYTVSDGQGDKSTATVTVLSHAGGVVWKFYESVLGRNPDNTGLQFWIADLDQGGSTGDMAVAFAESDELLDRIINGYYEQYLGRPVDASGLDTWKSIWRASGGPEIVQADIASSTEFFDNSGGTTSGWLTAIYERVLKRTPDAQGFNYWLERLASGTTEVDVVLAFLESPEAYGDDVTAWFEQDFAVAPALAQLNFYVDEMLAGSSDAVIEQQLASLPAYSDTVPAAPPGDAVRLPDFDS